MLLFATGRRVRLRQLVVSADDMTVDDAVLVTGDESTVARRTREALDVVDGGSLATSTRPQHHLTRRDGLTATGAGTRRTKHSASRDNKIISRFSSCRHQTIMVS